MPGPARRTPENAAELQRLLKQGIPMQSIALELGHSVQWVHRWGTRLYPTLMAKRAHRAYLTKADLHWLEFMLSNPDCSYRHAGEELGISGERVRSILVEKWPDLYYARRDWFRTHKGKDSNAPV
jgi:hypothetical protein